MTTRALRTQSKAEVAMTLRRGESLLLAVGIPVLLLGFFTAVEVLPVPDGTRHRVDVLAPGILALALLSTGLVSLGIATAFERSYGVLKRLAATPLTRRDLLLAKAAGVLVVEGLQIVVLAALAVALGWRPTGSGVATAVPAALLGTAAFAGLGLLLAGTLRAEAVLGLANGLYVLLLLLGGTVVPLTALPGPLETVARGLPSSALADLLASLSGADPGVRPWLVLMAWAVVTPLAAARWFRWE